MVWPVFSRCAGVGLTLALLLLAGCASRGVKVVLLPQADGSSSAVVVTSNTGLQRTLNQPYQSAAAGPNDRRAPVVTQSNPAAVNKQFSALFDATPAKAKQFTLYFKLGSLELVPESRITLFNAMDDALRRSGAEILVLGHTDSRGPEAFNENLSEKRARLIEAILIERGFTTARVKAVGMGEREPAVVTRDGVDEPRNRRVEIQVR
ncbi:MAG: OmpA family protein [Pseudomonadota bacterium]